MFIRRIHLQNFRSHADTTIDCERLTIIRGLNHAGKSSIEKAIEITCAGRTDETTKDGKDSISLIRTGESKARIDLNVMLAEGEERLIQCALNGTSRTVLVTKPSDPQYQGGKEWSDFLDRNREVLACLINNRHFTAQSDDAQKDILSAIILPKTYDWPEWVIPMCAKVGLKIDWKRTPFEVIAEGYDQAFKARTEVNRDVRNHRIPEGSTEGAEEFEKLVERVKERRAELETAIKAQTARKGNTEATRLILESAKKRLAEAEGRIQREEQSIAGVEAKILSKEQLKDRQKIAKEEKRAIEIEAQIATYDAQAEVIEGQLKRLVALSKEPECPTCGRALTDADVEALGKPLSHSRAEIASKRDGAVAARKQLGDPAGAAKEIAAHRQAVTDMESAKRRVQDDRTIMADAQAKIDEILASGNPAPAEGDDPAIAELRAKIQRGEEAVAKARAARDVASALVAGNARLITLQANQKDLETLVKYFEKDVKTELLAGTVGSFTEAMNAVLAEWGYACELSLEPYQFIVMGRPLKSLSKSERHHFATAFQVALAVFSGFKFVVCDEADIYDAKGRGSLFRALGLAQVDQAIVLQTTDNQSPAAPEQTAIWMLEAEGEITTAKRLA